MTELTTTPKTFEQRVTDKIKDQIPDLLTDADMKVMVERVFNDAFFKTRTVRVGYNDQTMPPLMTEIVTKCLMEQVTLAVQQHMKDNAEEINKQVAAVLQQGMGNAVLAAITQQFSAPLQTLQYELRSKGIITNGY